MPYDIRCLVCDGTQELPNEVLTVPEDWTFIALQRKAKEQKDDYNRRFILCPSCSEGVEDRIMKK